MTKNVDHIQPRPRREGRGAGRLLLVLVLPVLAISTASCCTDLRLLPYRDDTLVEQYHYALGEQYITVGGLTLCYQEQGEGEPILILPGLATSIDYWQFNIPALAAGHRVVALDLPGLGKSAKPADAGYEMSWLVERIVEFMDAKGVGRAAVIGGSAGGHLGLMLALAHPERVSKLVLVGTVGNWDPMTPLQDLAIRCFWTDAAAVHLLRVGWPIVFGWLFEQPSEFSKYLRRYDMALRADRARYTPYGRATGRTMKSLLYSTCRDRLGEIKCPVLLVYGEHDHIHRGENLEKHYREHLPDVRLVLVPHAAHAVMVDQPAIFNQRVLEFLAGGTAAVPAQVPAGKAP